MKTVAYKEPTIDIDTVIAILNKEHSVYRSIKRNVIVNYKCTDCNKECSTTFESVYYKNNNTLLLLCTGCKTKKTCLEKYGTGCVLQNDEIKERIKQTNIEKYGVANPFSSEEIKEKIKQHHIEHYGVDNYAKTEECREKMKTTCIDRYGTEFASSSPQFRQKVADTNIERYGNICSVQGIEQKEKALQTCLEKYGGVSSLCSEEVRSKGKITCMEKYGVEYPTQSEEIKAKVMQTNIKRYGYACSLCSEEIRNKGKITCLEKYGTEYYSQSKESHKYRKTYNEYNGECFDSKAELEFYKKCIEEGKIVIRHPIRLEYIYENKIHYYFPDFEVDGELIEIKGSHFLNKETGKWCNPFDHNQDKKYEAKYDCAVENNVKIIYVG